MEPLAQDKTVQSSDLPGEDPLNTPHSEGTSRPPGLPESEVSITPFVNTGDLAGVIPFLISDVHILSDESIKARPSHAMEKGYEAVDHSQLKDQRLNAQGGGPPPDYFQLFQLGGRCWYIHPAHWVRDPLGATYTTTKDNLVAVITPSTHRDSCQKYQISESGHQLMFWKKP